MTYRSSLAFLDSLVNYEREARPRGKFKLDNIRRLLELAGNPQRRLRNVILVAGTKGKGSTCYMLEAGLRGCGLATGLFVSPHVLDVRERIQLNGEPIPKRTFARLVSRLVPFVSVSASRLQTADSTLQTRVSVSYFELTTAMAFLLFAERRPDYCVIEVGLGGRLDATNLCEPDISVITRIGYDHTKVLGSTLTRIAREKAGIMRPGRQVVISKQEPEALGALKHKARTTGSRLVQAASVVSVPSVRLPLTGISFRCRLTRQSSVVNRQSPLAVRLPLLGRHQVENCRTALAVLSELSRQDPRIKFNCVARGLKSVSIPARCQLIRPSSLLPPLSSLFYLVDSCHNPDSGRALADAIRDHLPSPQSALPPSSLLPPPSSWVVLVYGSLSGKLVEGTVAPLAPYVHKAVLVQPDSPRAMPLAELSRIFRRLHIPFITAASVPAALSIARREAQAPAQAGHLRAADCKLQTTTPVVVAGSFYLAGEALKVLGPSRTGRGHRSPS